MTRARALEATLLAMLLVLQASHKWQQRLHINVFRDHKMIKLEIPYE